MAISPQAQYSGAANGATQRPLDAQRLAYEAGVRDALKQAGVEEAEQNNRQRADRPRNSSAKRSSSARQRTQVRSWSAAQRSRKNLGRGNTSYVKHYSDAVEEAQAGKSELMQQHEQILQKIAKTGKITEAEKAFLDSAGAKWTMLSESEQDATTHLGLMGNAYKELATANWQRIQQYQQNIEQIMQRQGAGLFSIAATAIGHALVVYMKHDHRNSYGHSGVGTEPYSGSEKNAIINATNYGLHQRGKSMGLQTVRPS